MKKIILITLFLGLFTSIFASTPTIVDIWNDDKSYLSKDFKIDCLNYQNYSEEQVEKHLASLTTIRIFILFISCMFFIWLLLVIIENIRIMMGYEQVSIFILVFSIVTLFFGYGKIVELEKSSMKDYAQELQKQKRIATKTKACAFEAYNKGFLNGIEEYFTLYNKDNPKDSFSPSKNPEENALLYHIYNDGIIAFKDVKKSEEYLELAYKQGSKEAKRVKDERLKEKARHIISKHDYRTLKREFIDKGFGYECEYVNLLYGSKKVSMANNLAKKYNCKNEWNKHH